jgi:hypothetical protein
VHIKAASKLDGIKSMRKRKFYSFCVLNREVLSRDRAGPLGPAHEWPSSKSSIRQRLCNVQQKWCGYFLQNGGTQLSDTISPWCNSVSIDPAKLSSSTVSELTNALL